ncbi:restriction endonuclease [Mycoplasma wenyonii str. Massachusetts]|uniref:Restriction endonuclease n=1 Tax=Mycoplasma wenyonii (strain Massachusetts) TaxID=1197325 RepID=I6YB67_MYCWM|nr:restriction endonuclease PLD domain-containing protein [Mycoplasma wenyonii]AFN65216.1 restriction endonuclease [Mycoplasma wenyonii str. Massachusetts]
MKIKFDSPDMSYVLLGRDQEKISHRFREELKKSNQLVMAVGIITLESLQKLEKLIEIYQIKKVCLILGIYSVIPLPDQLNNLVLEINERWKREGRGEIRLFHSYLFMGNFCCFINNNQIFSSLFGTFHLDFLMNQRKPLEEEDETEWETLVKDPDILENILEHSNEIKSKVISKNVVETLKQKIIQKKT